MCGIAGIRRYGDKPIEEIQIRMFLTGLENRGNDATGLAMQKKDGQIFVYKNDLTPWQFTKSKGYDQFIEEYLNDDIIQVILHTRAATKGLPRFNKNNHPMFDGKAAVVHNGVIYNDDELFRNLELDRRADTDSDILRGIVDKWGLTKDTISKMNKIRGGVATAMLHPEYPGWMLLARSGNPIMTASDENFFCFASEKQHIHRAMRPWVYRWKQWFQVQSLQLSFGTFPDNTAYLLGPEGLEWHEEFKSHTGTYHEPVRRVYQDYKERQRKWTKDSGVKQTTITLDVESEPKPESKPAGSASNSNGEEMEGGRIIIKCRHCHKRLALSPKQYKEPRWKLKCPPDQNGCGTLLADKPNDSEVAEETIVVH